MTSEILFLYFHFGDTLPRYLFKHDYMQSTQRTSNPYTCRPKESCSFHVRRSPFTQPLIPRSRKGALGPSLILAVAQIANHLPMTEHHLSTHHRITRPILKLDPLKGRVINRVMQHLVGQLEWLKGLLRIPDSQVGVKSDPNCAFLGQAVEFCRARRRHLDKALG